MRFLIGITISLVLFGCSETPPNSTGRWTAEIDIQGKPLPFQFDINNDSSTLTAVLYNGEEEFFLDEVSIFGDSIKMVLHIFDAEIRAKIKDDTMDGFFTKNFAKDYRLPFKAGRPTAEANTMATQSPVVNFSGKYQMTFVYQEKDTTLGIGIFKQSQNSVTGTILTPTGDYRYLNGSVSDNELSLHTFDGEHLYVFTATKSSDTTLRGEFRSGKSRFESWTATLNEEARLPNGDSLTLLKEGYTKIDFSFPGMDGKFLSPTDDQFKNKVLVLQLFGSWCSNCMDETKFLSYWLSENQDKEVAILGLAYEQRADFEYGKSRIEKMKSRLNVPYDFVLAGTKDKEEASKTLPMLNRVIAFPTLIFVGKDGEVKKIHTGFNGPSTGKYYEEFQKDFNETITALISE